MNLRLDRIHPNGTQPRKLFRQAELVELAENLKVHGQLQPIGVEAHAGAYRIVWGERRWRAAALAGLLTIEAKVVPPGLDTAVLSVLENCQRVDLTLGEESDGFAALLPKVDGDPQRLAGLLKRDERYVRDRLKLQGLVGAGRAALDAGLPLLQALDLAALSPAGQQVALRRLKGLGVKAWRRVVHALAAAEANPTLFEIPAPTPEERTVVAKYDRLLGQLERLITMSFTRDEVAVLARVTDERVGERARQMTVIALHVKLIRRALHQAASRERARTMRSA